MSWFYNLKIRNKLLMGFTFAILFQISGSIFAIIVISVLAQSGTDVFQYSTKPLGELAFMTRDFYTLRVHYRDLRLPHTLQELNEKEAAFKETMVDLDKHDKTFEACIQAAEEKAVYDDYKTRGTMWMELVLKAFQQKREGKDEQVLAEFPANALIGTSVATETLQHLIEYNVAMASQISDTNKTNADNIIMFVIIAATICAIISMILALYIARLISNPLSKIETGAQHIAKTGDLTAIPDIALKDEIGNVHRAMAQMVNNFAHLVKNVIFQINNITTESQGLSEISVITANATVELQAQTQTASSSSEQVSVNVATVSSSVEELATAIKEISRNTTAATTLTKESEEKGQQASEVMDRLGKSSQDIGNIVKSITDIAAQTNLLALNATIEAARAGEMGKGFAVVANEVKDLAKESAKAADDITHKIKVIQEDTKSAIDVIEGIIENITKINEVTTSIASAVEEQSVTTSEVNKNITEATTEVNSIVSVVVGITEAVAEYSRQSNKIKASSITLKTLASDLDTEIQNNFTV
jgi:methyl-accepting chemotaxis protein